MTIQSETHRVYLAAAEFVDNDHSLVRGRAQDLTAGASSPQEQATRLFDFVRDLRYGPPDFNRLESFKASTVLSEGGGYCVPKACAFVALCRASAIPARLAFADVTNHLATTRTLELMGGEVFAWHGYAEVMLGGRWLKVSPTFDSKLCARMGVAPVIFRW